MEENEVPQILLQAAGSTSLPTSWIPGRPRGVPRCTKGSRFYSVPDGRQQGARMKRSSIQQLKLRTRYARCGKLGHWVREFPEVNGGQCTDERYDRRAGRPEDSSKGFIASRAHGTKTFLSWSHLGEVLGDTGAHEGLVGEQQLKQRNKLLAQYGLQVEWSQEKPEPASGIRGATQPTGVAHVPVGLAGCNGVIRFPVVEQDVPVLLLMGVMTTLQASLYLDDNGDKVIFRQFGGHHCAH